MSAALNSRLAPKVWMKRRSWPCTLTISVWLVSAPGLVLMHDTSTRASRSMSATTRPKISRADAADDGDLHLHLGEIDRRIRRAAADGQQHAVGHDQLARGGQMGDRRADVVGDDDAGAQDFEA